MDVTTTLSLGDPLEPARKATAQMLQERERTFSLPQPFYSDDRLFDIDMQEIFQKEWLIRFATQGVKDVSWYGASVGPALPGTLSTSDMAHSVPDAQPPAVGAWSR